MNKIKREYKYFNVICEYIDAEQHEEVLPIHEKKCLDCFRGKNNNNLDVMKLVDCNVMRNKCRWLSEFGKDALDHSVDDVDSERAMSILTRINSNPLTKHLRPDAKGIRILAEWQKELVLRNIV